MVYMFLNGKLHIIGSLIKWIVNDDQFLYEANDSLQNFLLLNFLSDI